jgi:hypothetical protein
MYVFRLELVQTHIDLLLIVVRVFLFTLIDRLQQLLVLPLVMVPLILIHCGHQLSVLVLVTIQLRVRVSTTTTTNVVIVIVQFVDSMGVGANCTCLLLLDVEHLQLLLLSFS